MRGGYLQRRRVLEAAAKAAPAAGVAAPAAASGATVAEVLLGRPAAQLSGLAKQLCQKVVWRLMPAHEAQRLAQQALSDMQLIVSILAPDGQITAADLMPELKVGRYMILGA